MDTVCFLAIPNKTNNDNQQKQLQRNLPIECRVCYLTVLIQLGHAYVTWTLVPPSPPPAAPEALPPSLQWEVACCVDLAMLHWFACTELKLSACIKMGSGLEGAWFELTGLTPDTRYPPLCSEASSRTLMGSDIEPQWEMLMDDHVSKMLPAVHLILSIGLGGAWREWRLWLGSV